MLQSLRNNLKGTGAVILVGIIIVPFAFFGVETLFTSGNSANQRAEVNGESITEFELSQALQISKQQLLEQYKELDVTQLDDAFMQEIVLDKLIADKVLQQQAKETGMAVSVDSIYPLLLDVTSYQVDGEFSSSRYEYNIQRMGYTPTSHAKAIGNEMLQQMFLQAVVSSGFSTEKNIEQLVALMEQSRSYYYLTIPAAGIIETVEISDQEIAGFYEENSEQYLAQEKVKVEYVSLELAGLTADILLEEDAIIAAYEDQIKDFVSTDSLQVAHILIDNNSVKDNKTLLPELQQKLANGEDFATLAKQFSVDLGTADQGGLLGSVVKGDLPEPLEVALNSMQVDEVSAPVESDAGFHFLKLLDKQSSGQAPTLAMLRLEIENRLKIEQAKELFAEKVEQLQEVSYNAASLAETAQLLSVPLKISGYFSRKGSSDELIAQLPEVVRAAFSDDVLVDGYPSNLLEISDQRALVLRVVEHQPEALQSLDSVKQSVLDSLRRQKAEAALTVIQDELRGQLVSGSSIEQLAKRDGYRWQVGLDVKRSSNAVDKEIQSFAFSLPAVVDKPVIGGFVNASGDYILVSLSGVAPGEANALSPQQLSMLGYQYGLSSAARDAKNYQQYLVESAEVSK